MDFDLFFPVVYDQQRELERLVAFLSDWFETQRLYNTAFVNHGGALPTNATVNPTELGFPTANAAGDDYQMVMSDLQTLPVSQTLAHSTQTS